jgi:nicotinamide-nucleotide amidase
MSGRAVLICVGDELLSGRVADTNSPFMRDRLHSVGWRVVEMMTVGDGMPEISRALRCALQSGS